MARLLTKNLHIYLLGFCASILLANAAEDISVAPYLVSLRLRHNVSAPFLHRCTAAIYSTNIVLTPARCIVGLEPQNLQIVAGVNNRSQISSYVYQVESFLVHPDFSIFFIDNDVALLHLDSSLPTSIPNLIKPIDLADAVPAGGESAIVASWGTEAQAVKLHEVSVQVFSDAQCKGVYGEDRITSAMFCAAGANTTESIIDSCGGDGGSPLFSNGQAVGLVSWASFCGRKGHPNVYTNLVDLKPWILSQTESTENAVQKLLSQLKNLFKF